MPAGYIEPRKIRFHTRVMPHESCGVNQLQESREHSQIPPRKPPRIPTSFKVAFGEQWTLE
jgi:hypothetical protein